METPLIEQVNIDGKLVKQVIEDRLMPALEGCPVQHAVLAMLSLCVIALKPNADMEELKNVVQGASEFFVVALADVGEAGVN